ncbi:VOC family protein [Rhodococcus tibetensis]|uniref:VOC family protein n=1 Tax=Rhodococcus tibetensis TaxID=2965064 RepID=A0ABT1QDG7_9NOCA|nr:VOC family protein [Rhodococcus sp. FXJ9.536]MCQ4120296.1 VOC family protein [Rhodococcus sp. FXJ9.536]
MAVGRLGSITLDCADPSTLAAFWHGMLGGEITYQSEKSVAVTTPQGLLTAMRVPDHREPSWPEGTVPKQIHLDLAVEDLDTAQTEAVRLGARVAAKQYAPELCRVLVDPAGHPFCLSLESNFARIGA